MTAVQTNNSRQYFTSVAKVFKAPRPERVVSLAPSILSADFANLERDLRRMVRKKVYWTHVDVMDGHFVPNISIGLPVVKSLRAISSRLFLDTHLMIENPLEFLDAFVDAGSDLITIHAEAVKNLPHAIAAIRKAGVRVGVTIRPRTSLKAIERVLDKVDMVLIMTVEPGFGGQSFMAGPLSKVRELARRREREGLKFTIQVDGGISPKTVGLAVAAGANILVAGSAVFGKGGIGPNIDALTQAAMAS
jgi:ribulose-phosphate 3-epimerase